MRGAMEEVAEAAGRDAALALIRHFGGQRLRIPSRLETLTKLHPIVKAIGSDAAHRLCRRVFGEIVVPASPFTAATLNFYTFAKRRHNGASVLGAIAGLRIHERTAWKWNRILEDGVVSNRDFIAFGKAIGDEW